MTHNPLMSRERVIVPDRPTPTKAQKTAAWNRENGICFWCGKPVAAAGPGVEYDHREMRAISADDSEANLYPMHKRPCHAEKTGDFDMPRLVKVRGQEKLTKPKVGKRRGFTAWRKFDGTIVRKERG